MSVQTESFAVHATGSSGEADTAMLDRLEQEILDLDALILEAVQRRSELARSLAPAVAAAPSETSSQFDDLGPDGSAFDRLLMRLAAPGRQ
ncbi:MULTISPECIES: chorismate mutase [Rhodococcus]|uniref:Chorismate mutase n=1 Tax=Rhodococcus parequi TaxID=3137122 RepID=A0ABW9FE47_9NOCA